MTGSIAILPKNLLPKAQPVVPDVQAEQDVVVQVGEAVHRRNLCR